MKANFFIVPESFQYAGSTINEIEEKIENFAIDLRRIKETPNNEIFFHPDTYWVEIFENFTFSDILNNPGNNSIDRDIVQQLRIIWELKETEDSINHIKEIYLPNHNENVCYGLIAFNSISDVLSEHQLIYGLDGWFKFRRHFLGLYPRDADFFIEECRIYFEKLHFHDINKTTVKRLFPECVKKIIFHIGELNDKFPQSMTTPYNRVDTLVNFNAIYDHDGQAASPQGDLRKKNDLTFKFLNKKGEEIKVYCELHLKVSHDDNNIFSNDRRIYFHEGIENIHGGKILIGHIGKHL